VLWTRLGAVTAVWIRLGNKEKYLYLSAAVGNIRFWDIWSLPSMEFSSAASLVILKWYFGVELDQSSTGTGSCYKNLKKDLHIPAVIHLCAQIEIDLGWVIWGSRFSPPLQKNISFAPVWAYHSRVCLSLLWSVFSGLVGYLWTVSPYLLYSLFE
jgi:hypothetical protein